MTGAFKDSNTTHDIASIMQTKPFHISTPACDQNISLKDTTVYLRNYSLMAHIIKGEVPFPENCPESVANNYITKLVGAHITYFVTRVITNRCDIPVAKGYLDTRVITNATLTTFTSYIIS